MMGYGSIGWMGPWMIFAWIFALGGLAALAWLVFRLVRGDHSQDSKPAGSGSARTILDERFARGDIDADEYRQRRQALNGE
jgi:putative membrane protein